MYRTRVDISCGRVSVTGTTIPAKSLWPPSEESPPPLPLFQCCYNDVDFSFDIFLNLQNNIGQGVWGKTKPLSNVIVRDCLKELCKICSVVLRHVNLDSCRVTSGHRRFSVDAAPY